MRIRLILTGDELVSGRIVDRNGRRIARLVERHGGAVDQQILIGDDVDGLVRHLEHADEDGVDLVIITGGLGATADDLTRAALVRVTGDELVEHPEAVAALGDWWRRLRKEPYPRPWVEAMVPAGADAIVNPVGMAAGIRLTLARGTEVRAFPGVPSELGGMIDAGALADVVAMLPGAASADVGIAGQPESTVSRKLDDLLKRDRNPRLGLSAKEGVVWVHMRATGQAETARAFVDADLDVIRERFGADMFTVTGESLAAVVAKRLAERGETIAVAESLTGGLIGHDFTEIAGISDRFHASAVTYSNDAKVAWLKVAPDAIESDGAVSESVACAMAAGVRRTGKAHWGIATTGIAGPAGGSEAKPVGTVWVAVAGPEGQVVARHRVHVGDRADIKRRAAAQALDLLRRRLEA